MFCTIVYDGIREKKIHSWTYQDIYTSKLCGWVAFGDFRKMMYMSCWKCQTITAVLFSFAWIYSVHSVRRNFGSDISFCWSTAIYFTVLINNLIVLEKACLNYSNIFCKCVYVYPFLKKLNTLMCVCLLLCKMLVLYQLFCSL